MLKFPWLQIRCKYSPLNLQALHNDNDINWHEGQVAIHFTAVFLYCFDIIFRSN